MNILILRDTKELTSYIGNNCASQGQSWSHSILGGQKENKGWF